MQETGRATPPFRWDLVGPDRLGSMLDDLAEPDLWFLDDLVACSAKVLARSGNGDLYFVGRSLDSMFDLLSGALADLDGAPALARVPFSFRRAYLRVGKKKWRRPAFAGPADRGPASAGGERHHAPRARPPGSPGHFCRCGE